ncbi:MAG: penicillin-binding protein 2 [Acidobacteriota bacterium]
MKEHLDYAERERTSRRTRVIVFLLGAAFLAYGSGLWFEQVLDGAAYLEEADNNFLRHQEVGAYRGNILDSGGRVLVSNRLSFNVMLDRERLTDTPGMEGFVASVLGVEPIVVADRLARMRSRPVHEPVLLGEDVALRQAVAIEARRLEWPALSIDVVPRRSYRYAALAAHVLGYVGEISLAEIRSRGFQPDLSPGDIVGKTGIERVYERELQGVKGFKRVIVNSRGRVMDDVGIDRAVEDGTDIVLNLDVTLQQALEEGLAGQVGAGVFLDPRSGAVLAMASSPSFEPNLFARRFRAEEWRALTGDPLKPLQNRATRSRFSPGSTFKLVVAAAGLEEGIIDGSTHIFCAGSAPFYGRRFRCHKASGHGEVNLEEALVHSCNIYFYTVGKQLGIERIAAYARRLGLGAKTGIDLPAEDPGLVPTPEWKRATRHEPWYGGETISVAIGGGPISVTPIQMAVMAATLASGGRRVTPRVRRRASVPGDSGQTPDVGFSPSTIRALRVAMAGVVKRGTGTRVALEGIDVAAKTGTAQFSARSAGVDADDMPYAIRDHAWLVGFAPAAAPEIAFAVFIEHGGHGGTVAAPVARHVLETFFGQRSGAQPVTEPVGKVARAGTP